MIVICPRPLLAKIDYAQKGVSRHKYIFLVFYPNEVWSIMTLIYHSFPSFLKFHHGEAMSWDLSLKCLMFLKFTLKKRKTKIKIIINLTHYIWSYAEGRTMNWETFSQILSHDDCNTKIGQIWLAGILQITKTSKLKITPKMTDHRTVGRNLTQ